MVMPRLLYDGPYMLLEQAERRLHKYWLAEEQGDR
jgi:hypothetical protein